MDYLAKEGKNEEGEIVVPTLQNLGVAGFTDPNTHQATKLGSTEHDLAFWRPHGDILEAGFIQVKTIEVPTPTNIRDKVSEALQQIVKDFKAFLALHPDISGDAASRLQVRSLVALPSVTRPLGDHPEWILYREDLHPDAVDNGSLAENLHADIMVQSKLPPGGQLGVLVG